MTAAPNPSRGLNVALWSAQALLALGFAMAGLFKSVTPIAELAPKMGWVTEVPAALVRFIGLSEVAGALGLLLPAATRIKPVLTPIAAACLVVVMILGAGVHATRGEWFGLVPNAILGGLAAFVAWGRWKAAPIAAR